MTSHEPITDPANSGTRSLAPWVVFAGLLIAGIVCFFLFADRVPSLLQALNER